MTDLDTAIKNLTASVGKEGAYDFLINFIETILESQQRTGDGKRVFRSTGHTKAAENSLFWVLDSLSLLQAFVYTPAFASIDPIDMRVETDISWSYDITLTDINFDVLKNIKSYLEI